MAFVSRHWFSVLKRVVRWVRCAGPAYGVSSSALRGASRDGEGRRSGLTPSGAFLSDTVSLQLVLNRDDARTPRLGSPRRMSVMLLQKEVAALYGCHVTWRLWLIPNRPVLASPIRQVQHFSRLVGTSTAHILRAFFLFVKWVWMMLGKSD